jgi:SAM-dependent methyltransferase
MRELRPCCICGSGASTIRFEATVSEDLWTGKIPDPFKAHYRINRCTGCDLQFSSPILDDDGVRSLYEGGIATKKDDFSGTNVATGEAAGVQRTMDLYYARIRSFLPGRENFMEVGCDVGYLLDAARKDGFSNIFGCEPNRLARERASAIPGATISELFYEHWELPKAHFDALTLVHVLDHLVDPMSVLRKAHLELKPGGILFGVVHDVDCLIARLAGERFPPFNLYHHYFFSKRTLQGLLEAAGFDVLGVANTWNCYSLGFFLEKAPPFPGKEAMSKVLAKTHLARRSLTIPIGNIGIIARKPHPSVQ